MTGTQVLMDTVRRVWRTALPGSGGVRQTEDTLIRVEALGGLKADLLRGSKVLSNEPGR
jgi:hypothetical protein